MLEPRPGLVRRAQPRQCVATAGHDVTVHVWDAASGARSMSCQAPGGGDAELVGHGQGLGPVREIGRSRD